MLEEKVKTGTSKELRLSLCKFCMCMTYTRPNGICAKCDGIK